MSTSPTTALFDPTSTEKISGGTFAYIAARNRQSLYNLIVREFQKSGLTQTDLAKRLGKTTDLVCRWLSRPRNLETDTASTLLFAICGAALQFQPHYPSAAQASDVSYVRIEPKRPSTVAKEGGFIILAVNSNNPDIKVIPLPLAA